MMPRRKNPFRVVGGGRGFVSVPPPPPPPPASPEEARSEHIDAALREQIRSEMTVCPCCGSAYIQRVPRAPSIVLNLIGIFFGLLAPAPLNVILALWGARHMITPYWVWQCRSCLWEGQHLGRWRILTNLAKVLVYGTVAMLLLGWVMAYRKVAP